MRNFIKIATFIISKIVIFIISKKTIFIIGVFISLQLSLMLGAEQKPLLVRYWDILTGGGIGIISGVIVGLIIGGIGIATGGTAYGIGAWLLLGFIGFLGGTTVGTVTHIILHPNAYTYSVNCLLIHTGGVLVSYFFSGFISELIASKFKFE